MSRSTAFIAPLRAALGPPALVQRAVAPLAPRSISGKARGSDAARALADAVRLGPQERILSVSTFGRRLRAAGVPFETRQVLLGHKNGSITTHYSAAEIGELIDAVNRIDASRSTPVLTTLRVPSSGIAAKRNASPEALQ